MKSLFAFGLLFFAMTFCGITDRIKEATKTADSTTTKPDTNSETGDSAKTEGEPVETPNPSAKQKEITDGGEKIIWEDQGMGFVVPKGWNKTSVSKTTFNYGSPATGFLIVSISSLGPSFPMDVSLKAYYDQSMQKKSEGGLDLVRYMKIDDVKGVEFVEAMPEDKGDPRRYQWIGYRLYNNQVQMVTVIISTDGSKFDERSDTFGAILYSMKFDN